MNIEEIVEEKIYLENRLQAIQLVNLYGMKTDDRIELELQRIASNKRLNEINFEIAKYENPDLI